MMIKKMTAGLMAGVLMLGSLSAACYAASAENISKSDPALIAEDHADVSKNAAASKVTAGTSAEAGNTKKSDAGTTAAENTDTKKSDTETTDTEPPEAEMLPYDVSVDEDGNYTFTFGDWEWSTKDAESDGTDAAINDKVKSYLNLRSGSGTEYEIIGHLLPGEEVQVVSEDGDWYQVVIPERTGYVYKDYIDMLEAEEKSGNVDEEFLAMMLYLMMSSMNQTGSALTPSGNLTLVDDIGSTTGEGQQFITLVTKAGNYFYLIIDRNEKGEENVHFLNMVDEADLFALMDEDQVAEHQAAHGTASTEDTESEASTEDTSADAVQDNVSEPEVTKKKSLNVLPLVGVLIILGACGGSYFYLQAKKKKAAEQKPDPDADYTDEDEEEYLILEDDDDANEEDNDPNDGEYESEAEDMEASETTEE